MAQTVQPSTALTGKLTFTDTTTGSTVPGPVGTISADVASASPTLSADGQSYNFTSAPSGSVTLTWTDPAGVIAPFSEVFTDAVVGPVITGTFGPATPGTTA